MPEGPEVTIIAKQLNSLLNKKYLRSIRIVSGPYMSSDKPIFAETRERIHKLNKVLAKSTMALRIDSVNKKGKFIYFNLTRLEKTPNGMKKLPLLFGSSLGLTGHFILSNEEEYIRLEFIFADHPKTGPEHTLLYTDKLSMGKFVIASPDWMNAKLASIGVDALGDDFTIDSLRKAFENDGSPLFMAIVDQTKLSGVGNIYRSEILHRAKIDPFKSVKSLSQQEWSTFYDSIVNVLQESLKKGGTSENEKSSYRDLYNKKGHYVPTIYNRLVIENKPVKILVDSEKRKFYHSSFGPSALSSQY